MSSYWVIKNGSSQFWGSDSAYEWSFKMSSAVKFVEKIDAEKAIEIIDIGDIELSMVPYEVQG